MNSLWYLLTNINGKWLPFTKSEKEATTIGTYYLELVFLKDKHTTVKENTISWPANKYQPPTFCSYTGSNGSRAAKKSSGTESKSGKQASREETNKSTSV